MTTIGYAAMLEQFHPTDLLDYCAAGRGRRLRRRVHGQRALPSVDAAAGPERVRLGLSWARSAQRTTLRVRDRRHAARLPLSPGGHRPGRRDAGGACTRAGSTSASARARRSTSTSSAAYWPEVADPQLDDVRGDRGHQQALHAARSSSTRASTSRSRAPSSTRCPSNAAADLRRHGRPDQRRDAPASSPTASSPSARPTRRSRC